MRETNRWLFHIIWHLFWGILITCITYFLAALADSNYLVPFVIPMWSTFNYYMSVSGLVMTLLLVSLLIMFLSWFGYRLMPHLQSFTARLILLAGIALTLSSVSLVAPYGWGIVALILLMIILELWLLKTIENFRDKRSSEKA